MMIITNSFKIHESSELRLNFDVRFRVLCKGKKRSLGVQPHLQQRKTREISEVIYDSRYFIVHVRRHTA
jgi:hypothetical protein